MCMYGAGLQLILFACRQRAWQQHVRLTLWSLAGASITDAGESKVALFAVCLLQALLLAFGPSEQALGASKLGLLAMG